MRESKLELYICNIYMFYDHYYEIELRYQILIGMLLFYQTHSIAFLLLILGLSH